MPMYEVEWTEVKKHRANVLIPNDDEALHSAIGPDARIVALIREDNNPVISNGKTEMAVTKLGRVMPDGSVKPL